MREESHPLAIPVSIQMRQQWDTGLALDISSSNTGAERPQYVLAAVYCSRQKCLCDQEVKAGTPDVQLLLACAVGVLFMRNNFTMLPLPG